MADTEQLAREDSVSVEDLTALRKRAETAEAGQAQATQAALELQKQRDEIASRHMSEINRRVQADEISFTNAIAAAAAEGDSAERQLAEALAANDASLIAKAQRQLTRADMHLEQAETQNRNFQNWKQREAQKAVEQEEQAKRQPPQQQRPPDGQIDISGYSATTQEWLRQHPEILKNSPDGTKALKLVIADHYVAEARGLTPDTPAYFEFLEGGLQGRKAETESNLSPYSQASGTLEIDLQRAPEDSGVRVTRSEPPPRIAENRAAEAQRQTNYALPPSRASSPANGNRGNGRVSLTLGEQEAARASFPHLKVEEAYKEYAVNKVELQKEGRL
jgi:hypothetical protein